MLSLFKNKKAQSTIEYALLIAVVVGAFTAMQLYNRRSLNLRVKRGMDRIPFAILAKEQKEVTDEETGEVSNVTPLFNADGSTIFGFKKQTQYEPYYYAAGDYRMETASTEGIEESNVGNVGGNRTLDGQTNLRWGKQEITGTEKAN